MRHTVKRIRGLPWRWQLVPALAFFPLAVIAFTQYRWLGEIHSQSRRLEAQSNQSRAAEGIAKLQAAMNGIRLEFLPGVVHADVVRLNLDALSLAFDDALERYPYVDRFFVWSAPAAPDETLVYFHEDGVFRPDPELVSRFPRSVWRRDTQSRRWAEYRARDEGPRLQVVVHRVVDLEDTGQEGVVGITVDLDSFVETTLPMYYETLIAPLLADPSTEPIPVVFLGENNECLLGVPACFVPEGLSATVDFAASFGVPLERLAGGETAPRWRFVVAEPRDGLHARLHRGAMANLFVVGIGILILALGAALISRSMTREAELSELKSSFISGISHEIKTPLSLIRLYSDMLDLGRVREEDRKEFYARLRQQSEALGDMLEQMLDFSRIEAEKAADHKEACHPKEILEEAIGLLTAHGALRREVSLSVEDGLPDVQADRRGMVRAVFNLLDNAAKYGGPDQPILVRAARQNGSVALEVRDCGTGLDEDELPRVFDRFYRGRKARAMAIKGTGLGLSIAASVVRAHQGTIEVETRPGKGSSFTILLPASHPTGSKHEPSPDRRG